MEPDNLTDSMQALRSLGLPEVAVKMFAYISVPELPHIFVREMLMSGLQDLAREFSEAQEVSDTFAVQELLKECRSDRPKRGQTTPPLVSYSAIKARYHALAG